MMIITYINIIISIFKDSLYISNIFLVGITPYTRDQWFSTVNFLEVVMRAYSKKSISFHWEFAHIFQFISKGSGRFSKCQTLYKSAKN